MAISVVSFSFSVTQPEGRGPTLLAFSTASYHQLVWSANSIGGPEGPFGRVWLSLPHLVSDVSDPQLIRGSMGPLRRAFSTTFYQQLLWTPTVSLPSWPSYIIVQRPLNLWNGMVDRHQAEITVKQFRGHSLPMHQSMSVSWAFTLSHFISQIRPHDLFRLLAIGMCHFLPAHHFGMAYLAGSKVEIQHIYQCVYINK